MTVGALCFAPHQVEGSFFSLGSLTGGGNPCVGVGSGSGGIFGNGLGSGFGSGFGFMRPFSPSLSWGRLFGTSSFANPCRPAAVWMPSGSGSGWANNNNGWTSSGGYGERDLRADPISRAFYAKLFINAEMHKIALIRTRSFVLA